MDMKSPHIIALTDDGKRLAAQLAKTLGAKIHTTKASEATRHIRDAFLAGYPVIGICAAGILIRALSGHLSDKWLEPPVIAVSEDGAIITPLLGGHHGGHRLAHRIAEVTGGMVAITTSGDRKLGLALDEPPFPFVLGSPPDMAKNVMMRLLNGDNAILDHDLVAYQDALHHLIEEWQDWLAPLTNLNLRSRNAVKITLALAPHDQTDADLVFHPKIATLGLGASRNCPPDEMTTLIDQGLAEAGLAQHTIRGVYSIDLKADEDAILNAAERFETRLNLFTSARLEEETPRLQNPSKTVFNCVGCHSVSESAALAAAGNAAILIQPKRISPHATMAIALDPTGQYSPQDCRHPGCVMLVGIGPGQSAWRTPEATAMIARADELVGYSLYIDMLDDIARGKTRKDFALGQEEERCRYALETAALGKDIAIICSGDAGIYAMGALVFEMLARPQNTGGVSDAARRVLIQSAPGISALQAAAARTGAILGHDFCAISLSDLLTPWQVIENRITAAAEGDFVIAFYNPVSKSRRVGLKKAIEILLKYRSQETPVILASNLGRHAEQIRHRDLGNLNIDEIDMLTVVMVGSSASQRIAHHGGRHSAGQVVFTPRGYDKKIPQKTRGKK